MLSVLLTLMHSFGFEHGGWISKSFVAKAINRYKTSTESDQSTSLAGQSVCRFTTYSLCNLQCQRSCTMAIKDLLVVLSTVQCVYASKGSLWASLLMPRKYPQRSRCLLTASVPYKILLLSLMWLDSLSKDQFAHKLQKDRLKKKSKHKNTIPDTQVVGYKLRKMYSLASSNCGAFWGKCHQHVSMLTLAT